MDPSDDARWRAWIISELYYPEDTSTGAVLTELAEGLADALDVRVLCGQPTYFYRGQKGARREEHNGVHIRRCWSTTLDKNVIPFRVLNMLSLSVCMFVEMVLRFRRDDRVLVVTNPPLLPFVTALACRIRGARFAVLVHDVYPELTVATGTISADGWARRIIDRAYRWLYRRADRAVVLGRDMQGLFSEKYPELRDRFRIITNWANLEFVEPVPKAENPLLHRWGLQDQFVVQYAGNMGRTHALEDLVEAAARMGDSPAHFVFVGEGAKQGPLKEAVSRRNVRNVTVLPRLPGSDKSALNALLSACDVAVIAFVAGMGGISVPSRMYNILAAGVPIVAVADRDSELALLVQEQRVGWVVEPGDVEGVVRAVNDARQDPQRLARMGKRARATAEEHYSFRISHDQFLELFTKDIGQG